MKKLLASILIVITLCSLFLLPLSGCNKSSDTLTEKDGDTVDISLLMHGRALEDSYKYRQEAQDAINEKLYKDLGFKVNITATSYIDQFETMLSLDFAAGVKYDMIRAVTGMGANYAKKGILKDIMPYIDEYAPDIKSLVPLSAFAENSYGGKVFGIPTCSFPIRYGIWFRGDWLDIIGKNVPNNLQELEEVLEAFKTNTTINPKNDVIPMAGSNQFMEQVFLGMFTDHPGDYVDENGKIIPKHLDPGYRDFIEQIYAWFEKGYVDSLLINGNANVINDLISKDRVGIHVSNTFILEYTPLKSYNEQKNLNMKWSIPFAQDTKTYYSPGAGNDIMIFPEASEITDKVIQYYNWYYANQENAELVQYGIKDKTYVTSTDSVTGKPFVSVPEHEKTDRILAPMDLIGFFGTNLHASLQLLYTDPTRPPESAKAYDTSNTQEIFDNYHIDITRYLMYDIPGTLSTKFEDSKSLLYTRTTEMMVGKRPSTDKEWNDLIAEFDRLGGNEAYEWLTQKYNELKDTDTFSFLNN